MQGVCATKGPNTLGIDRVNQFTCLCLFFLVIPLVIPIIMFLLLV